MKKTDYVKDIRTGVVFLAESVEMGDSYVYIDKKEFDSYVDPHEQESK